MAAQRFAQNGLAVAFVIDVSGVEIVHAPIQGMADHARRFRFIDIWAVGIPVHGGQAHTAKAQN